MLPLKVFALTTLAPVMLPPDPVVLIFSATRLPLKLAVLPLIALFTVSTSVIVVPETFALAAKTVAFVVTLPARTFPPASTLPDVVRFRPETLAFAAIV